MPLDQLVQLAIKEIKVSHCFHILENPKKKSKCALKSLKHLIKILLFNILYIHLATNPPVVCLYSIAGSKSLRKQLLVIMTYAGAV